MITDTQLDDLIIFWIRRIFRYAMLGCAVVILAAVTLVFCIELAINQTFRDDMVIILKDNIVSVVIGVTAILGVNIHSARHNRGE